MGESKGCELPSLSHFVKPVFSATGGEGGIRTPDTLSGMPVFKTGAINHSATSPDLLQFYYSPSRLLTKERECPL
jgi:hypothetical protein